MGWSLKAAIDPNGAVRFPAPFFCMVSLFTIQIALGMRGTWLVQEDLRGAMTLTSQLAEAMGRAQPSFVPIPAGFESILWLTQITLSTNLLFWLIVAVIVYRKWQADTSGGPRTKNDSVPGQ